MISYLLRGLTHPSVPSREGRKQRNWIVTAGCAMRFGNLCWGLMKLLRMRKFLDDFVSAERFNTPLCFTHGCVYAASAWTRLAAPSREGRKQRSWIVTAGCAMRFGNLCWELMKFLRMRKFLDDFVSAERFNTPLGFTHGCVYAASAWTRLAAPAYSVRRKR